jgi:3-oxoacyl-[acyl-carrier-protein] synthase-3
MADRKATITGVGKFTPPLVPNADFINVFGKKAVVVDKMLPNKSRYLGIDIATGEALTTNTEMAANASLDAFEMAGIHADDIDMIIYATASPDYLLPTCFTTLQGKLKIHECMGMDIRSGCAGFGTALITAQQYIACGMADNVLVVGSELNSTRSSVLYNDGLKKFPLKALFNLMLFGDGAGAAIIQPTHDENEGIFCSLMGSNRAECSSGSRINVGGSITPFPVNTMRKEDWLIYQEPRLSEEMIPQVFIEAIKKFLKLCRLDLNAFDHLIFPIDSNNILEKVLFSLPDLNGDRIVSIGSQGGSMVNAAVPVSLVKAYSDGKLKKGNRILIYAAENTQWQYAIIGMDCSF